MAKFSAVEDEQLVKKISKYSILYDISHSEYRDGIWNDISKSLGKTTDDCKIRWRNIKKAYLQSKKISGTGVASSSTNKWPLADHLSFLDNKGGKRNATFNYEEGDDDDDDDYGDVKEEKPEQESYAGKRIRSKEDKTSSIMPKRLKNDLLKPIQSQNQLIMNTYKNNEDHVDIFCKSVVMSVKSLPVEAITDAKIKILTIVNELEKKYKNNGPEAYQRPPPSPHHSEYYDNF